jgi:hypothetical protein
MNEPSNFVDGDKTSGCIDSSPLDNPPFVPSKNI